MDFALLPDNVGNVVRRTQAQGLDYQGPFDGGRLRPDGEKLQWQIGAPPTGDLPFLCGDITPRALRVREGDVRVHANGVQGVASLTLVVTDIAASLQRYQILLDTLPTQAPTVISGLGIVQAAVALGGVTVFLLSPLADAGTASAQQLQQVLATRGEGLLGVTLRSGSATTAGGTQSLSTAKTHAAPFSIVHA